MTKQDLKSMSVDELWSLHELVTLALARKITDEKSQLDHRLRQLGLSASGNAKNLNAGSAKKLNHARCPYPQVFPKYRNPAQPAETWAGRGKQPRWLTAQLRSGKKLDDFESARLGGGLEYSRDPKFVHVSTGFQQLANPVRLLTPSCPSFRRSLRIAKFRVHFAIWSRSARFSERPPGFPV